jgi:hypothetical protein
VISISAIFVTKTGLQTINHVGKNEAVGWDNGRNLLNMSVPDEGYSSNVPDEGYSRNVSCALI